MTDEVLKKGQQIREDLDRLTSQLARISYSIENKPGRSDAEWQKRLYAAFGLYKRSCTDPGRHGVCVFFPGRLQGVEVDLDLDFVLLLKGYLEEKIKRLTKEFEELGEEKHEEET